MNTYSIVNSEYTGSIVTQIQGYTITAEDFIIQSDGKYVLFGTATSSEGSSFITARYDKYGKLDESFGCDGIAISHDDRYPNDLSGEKIMQDASGKLVAIGSVTNLNIDPNKTSLCIVRYNENGTIDTKLNEYAGGFDTISYAFVDLYGSDILLTREGYYIALATEGAVPTPDGSDNSKFSAFRLNADPHYIGGLDLTFGDGDFSAHVNFDKPSGVAGGLIQSDDKILLYGGVKDTTGNQFDIAISRLDTNGKLDLGFGDHGKVLIDVFGESDAAFFAVQQTDGKLIISGTVTQNGKLGVMVMRLDINGILDNSFGSGGITTKFFNGDAEPCGNLLLTKDGGILLSGYLDNNGNEDLLMMKLNANGRSDLNFGSNGFTTIDINHGNDKPSGLSLLPDGAIVVAGDTFHNNTGDFFLAHLDSNGNLSSSFEHRSNILGTKQNDNLIGTLENDTIDGYEGIDTVLFNNIHQQYSITKTDTGFLISGAGEGTDTLVNIERLQFADTNVALDLDGNAGCIAKILGVVFGPETVLNKEFVGIGLNLLDNGMSYEQLADLAINASGVLSNDDVMVTLCFNLFGSELSEADRAPFVSMLDNGSMSRGELTVLAAEYDLNLTNINFIGLAETDLEYLPYQSA